MGIETSERSYVGYAENSIVREQADRPLIKMLPTQEHSALDIGTGTGTGIQDLIEMKRLIEPFTAVGIDLDEQNLEEANFNPTLLLPPHSQSRIELFKGRGEDLSRFADDSQALVLCRNAIHLMKARRVYKERHRVTKPGGYNADSSGYMNDLMYPTEAARMIWGLPLGIAHRILVKEHNYQRDQIEDPNIPDEYSSSDLKKYAEEVGFTIVKTEKSVIELDAEAVIGLILYDRFAEGALPNIPIELAKKVLIEAFDHPKVKGKMFPRGFFYMITQKSLAA